MVSNARGVVTNMFENTFWHHNSRDMLFRVVRAHSIEHLVFYEIISIHPPVVRTHAKCMNYAAQCVLRVRCRVFFVSAARANV